PGVRITCILRFPVRDKPRLARHRLPPMMLAATQPVRARHRHPTDLANAGSSTIGQSRKWRNSTLVASGKQRGSGSGMLGRSSSINGSSPVTPTSAPRTVDTFAPPDPGWMAGRRGGRAHTPGTPVTPSRPGHVVAAGYINEDDRISNLTDV